MDPREVLGGLVTTALGLVLTVVGMLKAREGAKASGWPTTQGEITSSQLEDAPPSGRYIMTSQYRAAISYTYFAAGRKWEARRISIEDEPGPADKARGVLGRYPPGASVQVHYDSANPARAVLEPGVPSDTRQVIGGGLLLLVIGGALIVAWCAS